MRFMIIVKATAESEAGAQPSTELLNAMGKYNSELVKAGVLLAGEGLQPSSNGARVIKDGKRTTVVDGPFAETKELVSGFWILDVSSRDEALEWAKRVPDPEEGTEMVLEVRKVSEAEDFENFTPEQAAAEDRLREKIERQNAER